MIKNFEFAITLECNLKCKWCDHLCNTGLVQPKHMSLEEVEKYTDIIMPFVSPLSRIAIAGGEPTLHPQIFSVLDIILSKIRPLLRVPILFFSNGVGEKVSTAIIEMKNKYSVRESDLINRKRGSIRILCESPDQIFLVRSKVDNAQAYARGESDHMPIFRAAIDYMNEEDIFKKECWLKDVCGYGITSRGIFICAARAAAISEVFELEYGFNHMPSLEEESNQLKSLCKYCSMPCENLTEVSSSKTWEERLSQLRTE
jgi:hypothetical protein